MKLQITSNVGVGFEAVRFSASVSIERQAKPSPPPVPDTSPLPENALPVLGLMGRCPCNVVLEEFSGSASGVRAFLRELGDIKNAQRTWIEIEADGELFRFDHAVLLYVSACVPIGENSLIPNLQFMALEFTRRKAD